VEIEIELTTELILEQALPPKLAGNVGAWVEFMGIVREEESQQAIVALEYEAYSPMAEREMRRILEGLGAARPCLYARVIHRTGVVPVGEAAIWMGVAAVHRGEAFALLAEFMNRLKKDVPIWKRRALTPAEWEGARSS
jgi:molybdopterin synthase catalytic subunit